MSTSSALSSAFRKYLLPGFVFQSVVIAGGYGTGREIAEFFLTQGPVGGLLAMVLVSTVIWSAVCAASFEFARTFGAYEYRTFFRCLLGRGWVLFEVFYLVMLAIVLAVIAAAAGSMLEETFHLPYAVGVVTIVAAVGFLVFRGSAAIEKALTGWSFVLYAVYVVLFVWVFSLFGRGIGDILMDGEVRSGWLLGGVRYAGYNLAVIPAVLFVVRHAETRRQAVTAGVLAGPIAMVPGLLFYVAMLGQYPAILERPVPANALLEVLGSRPFKIVFQIFLFGTLIETGTAMIHAVSERMASLARERGGDFTRYLRPVTAVMLLLVATLFARIGLIDLIAKGYGTLTWAFLLIFVIPVLTRGVWLIRRRSAGSATP
jgi:uncharacterized membrane protein YkvI